jgi:hypothetical protein
MTATHVPVRRPHFSDRAGMDRAYRARYIFTPYYRLLNELNAGFVSATEDGLAVVIHEGQPVAAAAVIHGWVACWKRIEARRKIGADLEALSAIAHHLEVGHPIPGTMVDKARNSLDACLRAYKRLPLTLIRDAAQLEEMAIGFELLGVK